MYLLSVLEILCGKYFPQNFSQKFSYKMKKIWFLRKHKNLKFLRLENSPFFPLIFSLIFYAWGSNANWPIGRNSAIRRQVTIPGTGMSNWGVSAGQRPFFDLAG